MKWIGQHIWDFISRFRNDVYFENVQSGTVSSGDHLGIDGDGKVVKTSGGTGGGTITVKSNGDDDNVITTIDNGVTELVFYGADSNVKLYNNGTGSVIVDHHNSLTFANPFSITSTTVANYGTYRIADPKTGNDGTYGYNFHAGNWANTDNKATNNETIQFISPVCGNFLINNNQSKIKVTIFGPDANSSSDTNELVSHTLQVTGDTTAPHSQANGITIKIDLYEQDGTPDKKRARVTVTVDLNSSSIIDTSGDYTGSQKYSKIKIEQLDHNGAAISGVSAYECDPFFYDNLHLAPTASTPTVVKSTSTYYVTTKQLSNILYYNKFRWVVDSSNHTNMQRDTGEQSVSNNSNGRVAVMADPNSSNGGIAGNLMYSYLENNSRDSDDHTNEQVARNRDLSSGKLALNYVQGFKLLALGGLGGNSPNTSVVNDIARNYNNISSTANALMEDHKGEIHRISDTYISNVTTLSTAQTMSYTDWKTYCVGNDPDDFGVKGLRGGNEHLVQGYFNSNWGLHHPSDVSGLAGYPTPAEHGWTSQSLWNATSSTGTYYYYRFFRTTGSATSDWSIEIDGLPKSTFVTQAQTNSNLTIDFLAPGNSTQQTDQVNNQGTWIPLSTNHSSGNNNGCWANAVGQGNSSEQYDLAFNMGTTVLIIKIGMNTSVPTSVIKSLTMQTGHQNG